VLCLYNVDERLVSLCWIVRWHVRCPLLTILSRFTLFTLVALSLLFTRFVHSLLTPRTFTLVTLFILLSSLSLLSCCILVINLSFSSRFLLALSLHPCLCLVILVSLSPRSLRSLFAPLSLSCHSPLTISSHYLLSLSLSSHCHSCSRPTPISHQHLRRPQPGGE
jgi:hypothetical protein